jgi:hypothetical protein
LNVKNDLWVPGDDEHGGEGEGDNRKDKQKSAVDNYARARDVFITETRKNVFQTLEEAELPQQDVYIISREIIYRLMSCYAGPPNMIDDRKLLVALLTAAHRRRHSPASGVSGRQH